MKFKIISLVFLLSIGLLVVSCVKEEKTPEPTCTDGVKNGTEEGIDCGGDCDPCLTECETTTYDDDLIVVINKSCNVSGCHDGSNTRKPFTNYAEVLASASFINIRAVDKKTMPPSGALSEADRNVITCWIENGKKEK